MIEKGLKIRDVCGYYALDIPNYNGSNFTLYFNSKRNAENVKHIIEIDGSKPNEATVCDMQEIKHGKWIKSMNQRKLNQRKCSLCDYYYFSNNVNYNFCPNCGAKMEGKGDEK